MGTHYQEVIDLTGANAVPTNSVVDIPNPIKRIPDVITIEHVSGDVRLEIPQVTITPTTIRVVNPSLVGPVEAYVYPEKWHSIPR